MYTEHLTKILLQIKVGGCPPTLGFPIDNRIFIIIAEIAAKNIHKWGWERYVAYMEAWKLKVRKEDVAKLSTSDLANIFNEIIK